MLNYFSISKRLVVLVAIVLITSCASTRTIYDVKDKKFPAHLAGTKIKVYSKNDNIIEFAIFRADSTFIYGENDIPKIRRDEINKIEILETDMQKVSRHYLVGGLILTLLSVMFAP